MLLSAYRELKDSQTDITELDAHLEACAACRAVLAQNTVIGEQVRSLPTIEPHPQSYAHLMQALAHEHAQFMQRSTSTSVPTPDFLKPYLRKQGDETPATDPLTIFSTAETGPLPIIRAKRRRVPRLNQYAVLGLVAAVLLVLMTGGLTTLLVLANQSSSATINRTSAAIQQFSQVTTVSYATTSPYDHVVSALGGGQSIYYTAYNAQTDAWMLEQFDTVAKTSTPLLTTESSSSLVLLGSSRDWLLWLQLDAPKSVRLQHVHSVQTQVRTWRLEALPLGTLQQSIVSPITVLSGTFNEGNVPAWVHTPVQGIHFIQQDTVLIASLDQQGTALLQSIQLPATDGAKEATITLASTTNGHILTSPTADTSGTSIFWSDEWQTSDGNLHSNIWVQQTSPAPQPTHGRWGHQTVTAKSIFLSDGASFEPQVVGTTLFFLNTGNGGANGTTSDATSTATPATNVTPTATAATNAASVTTNSTVIPRQDASIYTPQLDAQIQGTLLSQSLSNQAAPVAIATEGLVSELQGGTSFLLWQSNKGYAMYDVATQQPVTVGPAANNAAFLSVNRGTAVWIASANSNTTTNTTAANMLNFNMFNWPATTQAGS